MVGALMLLKILHCKQKKRKRDVKEKSLTSSSNSFIKEEFKSITIKQELSENEARDCRVCLKEGNIPIFGNVEYQNISHELATITGLEFDSLDEFPKYICFSCHSLYEGAILLKKTAQQSDYTLRNAAPLSEVKSFDCINDDSINYDDDMTYEPHKELKKEKPEVGYHCNRCDLDFNTFEEYNAHKMTEEHETKRLQCPQCQKWYNADYLKRHLAIHSSDTPYMCDICGKKFIVQGHFTRHRLTHFYNLPHKCSMCPYRGRFRESLKMHMRTHTGEKPYQCTQCPSRFINKSNLNKHMLTHKGEHDFKCQVCGRGFYKQRDLDLHFKVDHTGIKDHVCNVCGKAFGYRKQMMKHQLKVHKREKLRSGRMPIYLQVQAKNIPLEET